MKNKLIIMFVFCLATISLASALSNVTILSPADSFTYYGITGQNISILVATQPNATIVINLTGTNVDSLNFTSYNETIKRTLTLKDTTSDETSTTFYYNASYQVVAQNLTMLWVLNVNVTSDDGISTYTNESFYTYRLTQCSNGIDDDASSLIDYPSDPGCDSYLDNEELYGGGSQGICGDGILDGGEFCDDSNTNEGDGCSSLCTIESGFTCSGQPSSCIYSNLNIGLFVWYRFNENIGNSIIDQMLRYNAQKINATWVNDTKVINFRNSSVTITNLNKALIFWDNKTLIANNVSDNRTISFSKNQTAYALDNFNLTEGIIRQYSPLNLTNTSYNGKTIYSNITQEINVTLILLKDPRQSILSIDNGGKTIYFYDNGDGTITITNPMLNFGNNLFSIYYQSSGGGGGGSSTSNSTTLDTIHSNEICADVKSFLSSNANRGDVLSEIPQKTINEFLKLEAEKYGLPESLIKSFIYSYRLRCNAVYPQPAFQWLRNNWLSISILSIIVFVVYQGIKKM